MPDAARPFRLLYAVVGAAVIAATVAAPTARAQAPARPAIHIAFLWHMHQPVYVPGESVRQSDAAGRFSYRIEDIFNQRTGPYTSWPRNAIRAGQDAGLPHAGASVSFSGSLIEGLNSLEAAGNGNFRNWTAPWREAAAWRTARGNARLDLVGFGYYHPLMPLLGRAAIARQIAQHRQAVAATFGAAPSKGIFTPENAFSTRIIPALRDAGVEWAMVDNIHIERAVAGYPYSAGGNLAEPNRADARTPNPGDWRQLNGLWAPTKVSAWARRPHRVAHTDPATGETTTIVAVPTDRYLGNEDGRGGFGALQYEAVMRQFEADNTDPAHPVLLVLHHDGDNYGGGSEGYYNGNFRAFVDWVKTQPDRFVFTTVQDYLDAFPPAASDVIHVENGSWSGADNGDAEFLKWLGRAGADGYSPDRNSWAVLTAATNAVETAGRPAAAVRWLDTASASDYWYWDGTEIWDSQVTRASNEAVRIAAASPANDTAAPTLFAPQRTPYNPGEPEWGRIQPREMTVWTYAYDVSGLTTVRLRYRVDPDGRVDAANQTFAGGSGADGAWQTLGMTRVAEPAARTNPLPTLRADRYEATLTGLSGVLVDYTVEATDATGRVATSDLQHVWIGTGTATGGGGTGRGTVSWTPTAPAREQTVTVKVAAPGTATARLHWGVNPQGSTWATPIAAYRPAGTALFGANGPAVETPFTREGDTLRATLGPFTDAAQAVSAIAFVVHYGDDTWDNNGGTDYRIAVSGSTGGGGGAAFVLDGRLDAGVAVAAQSGGRTLHAAYRGGMLYLATEGTASAGDAFVLVAETPGAPMAAMWGKGGTVATPRAFLARESTNGYAAWFTPPASGATTNAAYRMATGEMVEGTVDVAAAFGRIPGAVYVAAAEYATADGGALRAQAPAGNGDASLDGAEFVRIALTTTTAADGADASTGAFALGPLAPNPLVGEGRLPLRVARAGRVTVEAFDVLGRRVATLLDRDEPAGAVLVAVPAGTLAPGVYIVRASQHGETRTARIVVR